MIVSPSGGKKRERKERDVTPYPYWLSSTFWSSATGEKEKKEDTVLPRERRKDSRLVTSPQEKKEGGKERTSRVPCPGGLITTPYLITGYRKGKGKNLRRTGSWSLRLECGGGRKERRENGEGDRRPSPLPGSPSQTHAMTSKKKRRKARPPFRPPPTKKKRGEGGKTLFPAPFPQKRSPSHQDIGTQRVKKGKEEEPDRPAPDPAAPAPSVHLSS